MERKLKVGDRINDFRFGDGTIIGIKEDEAKYLVEFDKEDNFLHAGCKSLGLKYGKSEGKNHHCWWYNTSELTLIPKEDNKEVKSNTEEEKEEYVTKIEFEEFKKSIQPIEKQEEKPKDRADKDQRYWYIDDSGEICSTCDCIITADDYRYKTGNYYLTYEECERAKEIQDILNKYSYKFSTEELENTNVEKYYIFADTYAKELKINSYATLIASPRLFKTEEDCQKAINEIGYEDYLHYCVRGNIK